MVRSGVLETLTNDQKLRSVLEKLAPIASVRLVKRHDGGELPMRDFAFVDCVSYEGAAKIVEAS